MWEIDMLYRIVGIVKNDAATERDRSQIRGQKLVILLKSVQGPLRHCADSSPRSGAKVEDRIDQLARHEFVPVEVVLGLFPQMLTREPGDAGLDGKTRQRCCR
jgi:hypothetical protein